MVSGLTDPVSGNAVMDGTGAGLFSPLAFYTREQACLTVLRLLNCADLAARRSLEEYEASPVVKTVRKLVAQSADHEWTGSATQLMEAGRYITGQYLAPSVKALGKHLTAPDRPLLENDGILHLTEQHGSGGKLHVYRYASAPPFREAGNSWRSPSETGSFGNVKTPVCVPTDRNLPPYSGNRPPRPPRRYFSAR